MYELMVILKPLLPDDVRKALHKGIVKLVTDLGGEVKDVDVWGKRYLAYSINGHTEGYYIVYIMSLPAEKIDELSRQLRLKQEILRYIVVKVDSKNAVSKVLKKKTIDIEV